MGKFRKIIRLIAVIALLATLAPISIASPGSPACAVLATAAAYNYGVPVVIDFMNGCEHAIRLPASDAWKIFKGSQEIYSAFNQDLLQVTRLGPGQTMRWNWPQKDQSGNQVSAGGYTVKLYTITDGTYSSNFTIRTKKGTEAGEKAKEHIPSEARDNWKKVDAGIAGAAGTLTGLFLMTDTVVGWIGAGVSAGVTITAGIMAADDPSDQDYQSLVSLGHFHTASLQEGIIDGFARSGGQIREVLKALITSLGRFDAAIEAEDGTAAELQAKSVREVSGMLTMEFAKFSEILPDFAAEYVEILNEHDISPAVSYEVAQAFHERLLVQGLLEEEISAAKEAGLSEEEIKLMRLEILSLDPSEISGDITSKILSLKEAVDRAIPALEALSRANVDDLIWIEAPYPYGDIQGWIADGDTHEGVFGVLVCLTPQLSLFHSYCDTTDSTGFYSIHWVIPVTYKLTASKDRYETHSENVSISAGQTTHKSFHLKPL